MSKIIFLGSSAASITLIEQVRANDPSAELVMIGFDGHYPYNRDLFSAFIAGTIAPADVFCRAQDFFERHNVRVILDKKISRINFNRKRIFFEDREQSDYDFLILGDTPENRFPSIKGTGKAGVYGYKKLEDIDQLVKGLISVDTVAIQSDSFCGLEAALAFSSRGKEVILLTSENGFLEKQFDEKIRPWLVERFQAAGVRVIVRESIQEILGDQDVKAVRLQSGKVFSAEEVLFVEMDEDFRLFLDSGLGIEKRIRVGALCETNMAGVFAVDQTCDLNTVEPITPLSVLEQQGKVVAAGILGKEFAMTPVVPVKSLRVADMSMTVLGGSLMGKIFQDISDPGIGTYQRLYLDQGAVVASVLVNRDEERERLLNFIHEKKEWISGLESAVDVAVSG